MSQPPSQINLANQINQPAQNAEDNSDHEMSGTAPSAVLDYHNPHVKAVLGKKNGIPIGNLSNMGTFNSNRAEESKIEYPQTLKDLYDEYKQYKLMRKKDEMSSNQEVGTPAYLVSTVWLKRYHKFLLFDQFDDGKPEHLIKISDSHFRDMHPGQMTSQNDLCEIDKDRLNLFGTGELKGFESEYID